MSYDWPMIVLAITVGSLLITITITYTVMTAYCRKYHLESKTIVIYSFDANIIIVLTSLKMKFSLASMI